MSYKQQRLVERQLISLSSFYYISSLKY